MFKINNKNIISTYLDTAASGKKGFRRLKIFQGKRSYVLKQKHFTDLKTLKTKHRNRIKTRE